jgi:hypothetical protein
MFQWYSQAKVCYAYLSDVTTPSNDRPEDFDLEALRKSRWFTRGWTLQELIAPLTVQFFSSSWLYIGSKKQLETLISEITGIPVNILNQSIFPMDRTVYERMHWASRRQTTREEDMAYCLLGLFNVNIPLLCGEGKKAFHRLQEEIIKNFDDHTIFLWDLHPTKGLPEGGQMLVLKTGFYAGLLAESPHQFSNRCTVETIYYPGPSEPIQVSRKGSRMKLYLKKATPNSIASWPLYTINKAHYDCYLAALDCFVKDKKYIAEPTAGGAVGDGLECTAMLLLRRPDGSYERVLSYYETVSLEDVRATWEYSACYIGNPIWQFWDHLPDLAIPADKLLNLRGVRSYLWLQHYRGIHRRRLLNSPLSTKL